MKAVFDPFVHQDLSPIWTFSAFTPSLAAASNVSTVGEGKCDADVLLVQCLKLLYVCMK